MDKAKRMRIDKLLVDHGYFESRERAQRSILAGEILVEERVIDKPGTLVKSDAIIRVIAEHRVSGAHREKPRCQNLSMSSEELKEQIS